MSIKRITSFFQIDVVLAEPFSQAAHLPWEHLYFWYALNSLRPQLSPNVKVLPANMTIKAMGVEFKDLHKIRAPVGICEGFDVSEFDKLIEVSRYVYLFSSAKKYNHKSDKILVVIYFFLFLSFPNNLMDTKSYIFLP